MITCGFKKRFEPSLGIRWYALNPGRVSIDWKKESRRLHSVFFIFLLLRLVRVLILIPLLQVDTVNLVHAHG